MSSRYTCMYVACVLSAAINSPQIIMTTQIFFPFYANSLLIYQSQLLEEEEEKGEKDEEEKKGRRMKRRRRSCLLYTSPSPRD